MWQRGSPNGLLHTVTCDEHVRCCICHVRRLYVCGWACDGGVVVGSGEVGLWAGRTELC